MNTPKSMVTPTLKKQWLILAAILAVAAVPFTLVVARPEQTKLIMGVFFIVAGVFGLIAEPIVRARIQSRDGRKTPRTKFEIFALVFTFVMILLAVSMVLGY